MRKITGGAIGVVIHRDAEGLRGVEVELLVAAVEVSGGGGGEGLEGQVGGAGTCAF